MVVYTFKEKIRIKKETLDEDVLAEIIGLAEDEVYRRFIDMVSGRYVGFIVDSEVYVRDLNDECILDINLVMDVDISPLSEKIAEQDRIVEELAGVYFGVIKREVLKLLGHDY